MENIKRKKEYQDFHIEIEKDDAIRLLRYCELTDYKFTSVFRRSMRQFLDSEEKRLSIENNPTWVQKTNELK
jgi:hypothetical protein